MKTFTNNVFSLITNDNKEKFKAGPTGGVLVIRLNGDNTYGWLEAMSLKTLGIFKIS